METLVPLLSNHEKKQKKTKQNDSFLFSDSPSDRPLPATAPLSDVHPLCQEDRQLHTFVCP